MSACPILFPQHLRSIFLALATLLAAACGGPQGGEHHHDHDHGGDTVGGLVGGSDSGDNGSAVGGDGGGSQSNGGDSGGSTVGDGTTGGTTVGGDGGDNGTGGNTGGDTPPDLDGDGIPDAFDSDRDGDGIPNVEDPDPDVADRFAPALTLDQDSFPSFNQNEVVLQGSATDVGSHVISVVAVSDQAPSVSLSAILSGDRFTVHVPVVPGTNLITVTTEDEAHNRAQHTVTVVRLSLPVPPTVVIDAPLSGTHPAGAVVDVTGHVLTSDSANQVRVSLGGHQITPRPVAAGRQDFIFSAFPLQPGVNHLLVQVESPSGEGSALVDVTRDALADLTPPVLRITEPSGARPLANDDLIVIGEAEDASGIASVRVNGVDAMMTGADFEQRNFQAHVNLAGRPDGPVSLPIIAVDAAGNQTMYTLAFTRDAQAPRIQVDAPAPIVGDLLQTLQNPVHFQGTITDAALSGFEINNRPVQLVSAGSNAYTFSVDVLLPLNVTTPVTLEAWNAAGVSTQRVLSVQSTAALKLELLAPLDGAKYLTLGSAQSVDLLLRAIGAPDGTQVVASGGTGRVVLDRNGNSFTGTLSLPTDAGAHTVAFTATAADGTTLASGNLTVNFQRQEDIPLAVQSTTPANGAADVEPNAAPAIFFNRAIDASKLSVQLQETVHGLSYDALQPGKLLQMDHDLQLVHVQLSLAQGDQAVGVHADRDFAYGSTIYGDVQYDGRSLSRFTFTVRPPPTFLRGVVSNAAAQPVAGIEVRMPDLGLTTTSDADGVYSFGYGGDVAHDLPAGAQIIVANPGLKNPHYGSLQHKVLLQAGKENRAGTLMLPYLGEDIPFSWISGSAAQVSLAQGDLLLNLTGANLTFPNSRKEGAVHAQFQAPGEIAFPALSGVGAAWAYAVQPPGIAVDGAIGLTMSLPTLYGSRAYVPSPGTYVLLLGFDEKSEQLVPVGVASIVNAAQLQSVGPVHLARLDYIGVAFVPASLQPQLAQYAAGQLPLSALIRTLQP